MRNAGFAPVADTFSALTHGVHTFEISVHKTVKTGSGLSGFCSEVRQKWEILISLKQPRNYIQFIYNGADKRIRTSDLRITNAPLYHLSYVGS